MNHVKEENILIGTAGLFAVIIFALCWFTAALSDPTWVFGTNYLSDLGVSDYEHAHELFNGGCLAAGILFALLGVGLIAVKRDSLELAAGVIAIISGISISLIGIVTSNDGNMHAYIAYTAFGTGFMCLMLLTRRDWIDGLTLLSWIMVSGFVAVILSALFLRSLPGIETVATSVLLALFFLQGMKFLYRGLVEERSPEKERISDKHKMSFGFAAVLASVLFLILMAFAILSDESWVFGIDPVYLLGSSAVIDTQHFISVGCITGGLFMIMYGIGAGFIQSTRIRSVGGTFAVLAGITFSLIGVSFLAAYSAPACAEYFAVAFGAATMICVIASDWMSDRMITAAFYLIVFMSLATSVFLVGYDYMSAICIVAFFTFLGIEGARLIASE